MAITFNHNDQVYIEDGKIGIGTNNPGAKLHVLNGNIKIQNDTQGGDALIQFDNGYTQEWAMGMTSSPGPIRDFVIYETSTGSSTDASNPRYIFNGNGDGIFQITDAADGDINVSLNTNGVSYLNGGFVGIGTTNPLEELEVKSASFTTVSVNTDRNTAGENIGSFAFYGYNSATTPENMWYTRIMSSMTDVTDGSENGDIFFQQLNDGTGLETFRVKSSGTIQFPTYGAGYLRTDADGNVIVDISTVEDTLDTVTTRDNTTDNSIVVGGVGSSGEIALYSTGTADATNTEYHSHPLRFSTSGWDTNNSVARNVHWNIRSESASNIYPDAYLTFYEENISYNHWKLKLPGRGSGSSYIHPDAALFNGNIGIYESDTSNLKISLKPTGDSYFTNNLGIGITSPTARLYVKGDAVDNVGLTVLENDYASGGIYFPALSVINTKGNHSYGIVSEFRTNTSGDSDRPSILFYGAQASHSWQIGQVTSGWGSNDNFGIGYRESNDPTTFDSWPTNYFTITTGGNVGIGTTAPLSRLHVSNTTDISMASGGDGQFRVEGNGYTGAIALDATAMYLYHNSAARNLVLGTNETAAITIHKSNQSLDFNAYGAGGFKGDATYVLGVDSSGNVVETTTAGVYFGTNTSNGTYTNQWQRVLVIDIGNFDSQGFRLRIEGTGNTSGQSIVAEIEFNYKNQNGAIRARTTVNSYGTRPVSKDDVAVYFDTTNLKATFYFKVNENYTAPIYSIVSGRIRNYAFYSNVIGDDTALALETNDSITSNLKFQGIVQDQDSGLVGIGTSSPGAKLAVEVAGTADVIKFTRDAGANGEMTFDFSSANSNFYSNQGGFTFSGSSSSYGVNFTYDGNVGIGTTSPSAKLDVRGGAAFVGDYTGTVTPTDGIWLERPSGNSTQIQMYTTGASIFRIASDGTTANIGWGSGADREVNFQNTGAGTIKVGINTGAPSSTLTIKSPGDVDTYGDAFVVERAGTTAKLVRIYEDAADGFLEVRTGADDIVTKLSGYSGTPSYFLSNVGIGTDNPSYKLDVYGSARIGGSNGDVDLVIEADADNTGENDNPRILLKQDGGLVQGMVGLNGDANFQLTGFASNSMYIRNTGYPVHIAAGTTLGLTVETDGDVIIPNGNVGIGTTTPDAHLEISANAGADPSPITNPVTLRLTDAGSAATGQGDTTNPWAKIEFYSEDQSSGGPAVQAQISTIYDDIYSAGSHISFSNTSTPTNGLSEKMRINSNGTIRFNSYGAGFLQTDANGNITAGAVTTSDTLDDVTDNGNSTTNSIILGDSTTNGTMLVRGSYASGNIVVIGGMKSSGGAMIGYAVKPDTANNHGFVSSSAYTLERAAYYQQGNRHRWYAGASQNAAIGNAVTISETMRLDFDKLGLSTSSPASLIHLGKPTNGANIITFGEAGIGGPHGLDFYGDDATRTKKFSIYYRTGTENISIEDGGGTKRWEITQSGAVTFNQAFTFPTADGSAGAALVTNGSGSLSWGGGYQQYTPVGWGILNNQTYTSTGANISSSSTQAQSGTTPVQRNSATEFEATKAGWYEISYSFIVKNNYANRAMVGAYMSVSTSGGGGIINGSHSTQYVRYTTYGEYAQIQNTFYYYTSYSSTLFYLYAYLLSGSMNMTTQAISQSMISFRYINNDIT